MPHYMAILPTMKMKLKHFLGGVQGCRSKNSSAHLIRVLSADPTKKCKEKEEIEEKKKDRPHRNPMTPKDDIHQLYKWKVGPTSCIHSENGWNVTIEAYREHMNHYQYYRKHKPA